MSIFELVRAEFVLTPHWLEQFKSGKVTVGRRSRSR